jgi:hypothetical protein
MPSPHGHPGHDQPFRLDYLFATDLDSNGFTLTVPGTGDCFITAQIISEEHMSHQLVGGGVYKFTGKEFNGSHVAIGIRVGTDASAEDIKYIVEKLQPQMKVVANAKQPVSTYDNETVLKVRAAGPN